MAPTGYVIDSLVQYECQAWHKHGILKVSFVLKAKDLWNALLLNETDYPCGSSVFDKGIIIGPKRQKWRELSQVEQRFLCQRECISTHVQEHNKIWYNGEVFKVGDTVVVKSDNYVPGSFSVDYYKQSILVEEENERLNVEPITGMSVLQQTPMPFTWDYIREVSSLLHKFIPWSFQNSIIAYEIKDLSVRKRLLTVGVVGCVPPWVEEMDIVQIKQCDDRDFSSHMFLYVVVREVDVEKRKVRFTRLLQMQSSTQLWKAGVEDPNWQDISLCVAVVSGWECSMAQNGRPAPSYADIFCPPEPKLRDPSRLYGKKLLEVYYNQDHYPAFLQNYRDVRKWFKDYPFLTLGHQRISINLSLAMHSRKGSTTRKKPQNLYTSQGEHDPKKGNLDLNVAIVEEEIHNGSGHENTPTTMREELYLLWKETQKIDAPNNDENLENLDIELENSVEHQSFVSLLTNGNLKRVRAMPQSPRTGETSQLVSKPTSASLQVPQQDGESIRKSNRERKMSEKLRNSTTCKKPRLLLKKKRRQDIGNINDDSIMAFVENVNGDGSSCLSNDTIHDKVSLLLTVEEKETILLKYFDLQTIEDMYLVLKASFFKIRKEETTFRDNKRILTLDEMRESLVEWLLSTQRVLLRRQLGHDLTFDEVDIVSF
ncbi:hypothetical protein GOP47_0003274 [Adiantum capillus-veneris]|uniref:Uncharacterized protein n=1 Tax=Adiantum capillus-veneris TaxID=13818 RepID=A0A9D4ZRP1_ADICA|nr:hypothetical protein GOP47_0003274 [Adiantum capillus-veneris]